MTVYRYIREDSLGNGSGSSWANAAGGLAAIPEQCALGGPDSIILLRAGDKFETSGHGVTPQYQFSEGSGALGNNVRVRGSTADTSPAMVDIVGQRMRVWDAAKRDTEQGRGLFDLAGASYITFSHMRFLYMSYVFRTSSTHSYGIHWENCEAIQIRRFLEAQSNCGLRSSVVDNLRVRGVSKHALKMRNGSRFNTYRNVWIDCQEQDGDNFNGGLQWDQDAHGERIYNVRVFNLRDTNSNDESEFWNADGFTTEDTNDDFEFHDCWTFNSSDGGFDLKSTNTLLVDCGADLCKRSIRSWSPSVRAVRFRSSRPRHIGGTESAAHVWHNDAAGPLVMDSCTFLDGQEYSADVAHSVASTIKLVGPTFIRQRPYSNILDSESGGVVDLTEAQIVRELFDENIGYGSITPGATTTADNGAGGAGMVINKPTVSVGQMMIMQVYANGGGDLNTPSGWTAHSSYFNSGSNSEMMVLYRIVNGTEPVSWTVTHATASRKLLGGISAWSGVRSLSPIGPTAQANQTTASVNHTSAAMSSTWDNHATLLYLTAIHGTGTMTSPVTELYDVASSAGGMAIEASYEAWTTGVGKATTQRTIVSSSSLRGIVATIALRPIPG